MSKRRNIKILLTVYILCLLVTVVASLYLLKISFSQFQNEIYENSQGNLKVIDTLNKIETNLYIYKNSMQRLELTGNDKWRSLIKESEQNLTSYFDSLETYNDTRFNDWVRLESFAVDNPVSDLNKVLNQYHEDQGNETSFQRVFYLVRYNIQRYIGQKKDVLAKRAENQMALIEGESLATESPEEGLQIKTIFAGVNQLLNQYNLLFWDRARQQEGRFERNMRLYYRVFAGVSVFLVFFSLLLFWQVLAYLNKRQSNEDSLVLLGTRDGITGLFNRRSCEIIMGQELERAKRRGYHLSLLLVKVEPFEQIRQDLGQLSLDRLMFQIAETLRNSCRVYDGLFKYDDDTFVLVHPEADLKAISVVVNRFKGTLYKKEFLVKSNQTRVIPKISVGMAIYPTDGVDYPSLIKFATGNLSVDFGLKPANDNPTVVEPIVFNVVAEQPVIEPQVESVVEIVPEPVAETVLADAPVEVELPVNEDAVPDVVAAMFQEEDDRLTIDAGVQDAGVQAMSTKFADVQVVNAEGQDVIMVDFDREKDDLAQKFRKKLFDKRKKS